ncbi:MAG: hypothetical protein RIR18_64 [Pseudomonadota bacterium]
MRQSRFTYLLLGLLTLLVLVPGIWEPTGLSGKDEYFLGLRTPMEMMARGDWLVPFLDGAPRIRKPPLLYWLGRSSYEIFGISLSSARMVTVLFSVLLVISTAGIARRLLSRPQQAWIAGGVLLACLGLHTEGRRFMLDIPVVALSTAAFWAWLVWLDCRRWFVLTLAALLLAAGFMVKGPVVLLVLLGGGIAHSWCYRTPNPPLQKNMHSLVIHFLLLLALTLPWFWVVRQLYPDAVAAVVTDEVESRQFLNLTPGIFFGLLNISLPWFFVFFASLWQIRRERGLPRALLVWFAITFIPFLFLKSFDRYLLGSLVPLALLVAMRIELPNQRPVWAFRAGLLIACLLGLGLSGFAAWFHLPGWGWLALPMAYLIWAWFKPTRRSIRHLLAAPALYWLALMASVFPSLGVGAIPPEVVDTAKTESVALYEGPQPAMLAILSAQPHRHYAFLRPEDFIKLGHSDIFAEEMAFDRLFRDAKNAGVTLREKNCFLTLASHGSGIRFTKPGASPADWQEAFTTRDLTPLKTRICSFTATHTVAGVAP